MMQSIKNSSGLTRGRGVTEQNYSGFIVYTILDAMTTATNLKHRTSEQHMEKFKVGVTNTTRLITADLHYIFVLWLNFF